MNQWNSTTAADIVTVMLAAPQQRKDLWLSQIAADDRFRVTTTSTTPDDFNIKSKTRPIFYWLTPPFSQHQTHSWRP